MIIILRYLGVWGRVVVLELLVAGSVALRSPGSQPAIEATACIFGSAKRLLQRSKIEGD